MSRTIKKTFQVYKYNEASKELKEKIRDDMVERITTLNKVAELLDGTLDYSLSCIPDRGEFIKITPKYEELNFHALWENIDVEKECPLTGICYDHDIIDHLNKYNMTIERLNYAFTEFIDSIHDEYESMCEDDYISDMCETNDYEFTDNGKLY